MHKYHFVAKNVAPKRAALAEAQNELAESQRILDAAKARLYEVQEGMADISLFSGPILKTETEVITI